MAFLLRNSDFLENLKKHRRSEHVLIVERTDVESTTGLHVQPMRGGALKRLLPESVKLLIKRRIRYQRALRAGITTPFARDTYDAIVAKHPDAADLPVICADISDPGVVSFERFCSLIAQARAVASNRLHVGILAALLDKPTLIRPASYHKIKGIYDYSMARMEHTWIQE